MPNKDWRFSDGTTDCSMRSVGVLVRDGKILVQREKDNNEYALPGGGVAIGETGSDALIREFKEESGADINCHRLIWFEENFFKWNGRDQHNICLYYLISLKNENDIPDIGEYVPFKDNPNVGFEWIALDQLDKVTIYPQYLPEKIHNIADGVEHFVRRYN